MEGVGSALVAVGLRVWGVVCVCDAHSNKARTGTPTGTVPAVASNQLFSSYHQNVPGIPSAWQCAFVSRASSASSAFGKAWDSEGSLRHRSCDPGVLQQRAARDAGIPSLAR